MEELLKRLHAILGLKFVDMFNGADMERVKSEWSAALADFRPVELERGLAEVATRRFAPTLGEFAQLCRPCLDPEWAFREAEHCLRQRDMGLIGDWSHPAVWRAACEMGQEVRSQPYKAVATRWAFALKRELASGWGQMPPAPAARLPNNTKASGDSEVALRERAKLAELLKHMPGQRAERTP